MNNSSSDITYNISLKLIDIKRKPSETDEDFESRILQHARLRLSSYLSGHVYDPDKRVFTETISIKK